MLQSKEKIGRLDREITFIQAVKEQGESNERKIIGWEEIESYPNVNARKIETSGNTFVANERIQFSQQVTWVIRYRDDLNIMMRLVLDTKVYEILNIAESDESRKRYMNIVTQLIDNEYFT